MAALALIKGTVVRFVTSRELKKPVDVFGFGWGGVVAAFEPASRSSKRCTL
jgi:surfactin synthase thioesterase subunit